MGDLPAATSSIVRCIGKIHSANAAANKDEDDGRRLHRSHRSYVRVDPDRTDICRQFDRNRAARQKKIARKLAAISLGRCKLIGGHPFAVCEKTGAKPTTNRPKLTSKRTPFCPG